MLYVAYVEFAGPYDKTPVYGDFTALLEVDSPKKAAAKLKQAIKRCKKTGKDVFDNVQHFYLESLFEVSRIPKSGAILRVTYKDEPSFCIFKKDSSSPLVVECVDKTRFGWHSAHSAYGETLENHPLLSFSEGDHATDMR